VRSLDRRRPGFSAGRGDHLRGRLVVRRGVTAEDDLADRPGEDVERTQRDGGVREGGRPRLTMKHDAAHVRAVERIDDARGARRSLIDLPTDLLEVGGDTLRREQARGGNVLEVDAAGVQRVDQCLAVGLDGGVAGLAEVELTLKTRPVDGLTLVVLESG